MNDKQKKLSGMVVAQLTDEQEITHDRIEELVKAFSMVSLTPLSVEEQQEVVKDVETKLQIRIDRGAYVKEKNHKHWYNAAKVGIDSKYWNRYVQYLKTGQGWGPSVINELDNATDDIMDLLGNPRQSEGFQRRGLCIGEVQSGKTSNYIGLINKAADAGYRVFILLTGVIEKLRSQTQQRIDSGFIGLDSDAFQQNTINRASLGVGKYDGTISGWAVTSKTKDFNKNAAKSLVGQMESLNSPIVFVVKKNSKKKSGVLSNLESWLSTFNTDGSGKVNLPMLLIDDEADNASVNTNKNESPSVINGAIRSILNLFTKASYVGYTATPYANIFIDPDSETEMLNDDLFPRDFIYALSSPSNYIGAQSVFLNYDEDDIDQVNGKYHCLLCNNDDCEEYLPLNHKKGAEPGDLPKSLKRAIIQFFLANVIRDLRGDVKQHRTMMINISRYIEVQNLISRQVSEYVKDLQTLIGNYYLIGARALVYPEFQFMKEVYEQDFYNFKVNGEKNSKILYSWDEIQKHLKAAVAPIIVKAVNGGNASRILDYDAYKEDGLRLIAVGGLSLSRGLTLEGLCTSYFYRNSKMYDTLLQMGRWFGYRKGYDDLCRIWMSENSVAWYQQITEATDELKRRIRRMQNDGATPEEFGLCVRQDETALLVTARNKMKTAQDYVATVTLSGSVIDTKYLSSMEETATGNKDATVEFLKKLLRDYKLERNNSNLAIKNPQFLNVDSQIVFDYLMRYKSHYLNTSFQPDDLKQVFENDGKYFPRWDVVIAQGAKNADSLNPIPGLEKLNPMIPVSRGFGYHKDRLLLQISDKSSHLFDKGMAKGGLSKDMAKEIESRDFAITHKKPSANTYFQPGIIRNPLLVIFPIRLNPQKKGNPSDPDKVSVCQKLPRPLIGLGIGFPSIDGKTPIRHNYKINVVMQKQLMEENGDLEDTDGDYEETDNTIPEDN